MATKIANSSQRVSSTSSLRMSWTVLNADQRQEQAEGNQAGEGRVSAARATKSEEAALFASSAMSDLLHFRPAKDALRQEDHDVTTRIEKAATSL